MSIPKILLVDDEPLVLRSMQKTLMRAGYEVETASNSVEALQFFQTAQDSQEPFTLAVLDLNIPDFQGLDNPEAGIELLIRLRQCEPNLDILVLSAYDEVGKAKKAMKHGARAYCVKGREQTLLDQIKQIE